MKKLIDWLGRSNRYKHLLGGIAVGAGANTVYCAAYAGIGVAAALEFKDWQHGGRPDIVDFAMTVAGVAVGYAVRILIINLI